MLVPHGLEQRVYIEDTDQYGVVYYANYLKFFERARSDWLNSQDQSLIDYLASGVLFVVRAANINYLQPLKLHDRFIVTALPKVRSRTTVVFEQTIYRVGAPDTIVVQGEVVLVTVNPSGKVIRVPDAIVQLIGDHPDARFVH